MAAATNSTGRIPLNVTFQLSGTDADHDALTYNLTFGDGSSPVVGSALPATIVHAYTLTGNFTVLLIVADGKAAANATVLIHAVLGAPAAVVTGSTSVTGSPVSSGVLAGGTPGLGAKACSGYMSGKNGQDCVYGALPAGLAGHAYAFTSDVSSPDYELWDKCDGAAGKSVQAFGGKPDGPLPAGVGCVIMWNFGSATGKFTFTVQ